MQCNNHCTLCIVLSCARRRNSRRTAAIHATQLQFMREAQFMPRSGKSLTRALRAYIACRGAAHIEYREAVYIERLRVPCSRHETLSRISSERSEHITPRTPLFLAFPAFPQIRLFLRAGSRRRFCSAGRGFRGRAYARAASSSRARCCRRRDREIS